MKTHAFSVYGFITLLVLSGCATVNQDDAFLAEKKRLVAEQGASPDYTQGFQDACEGVQKNTFKKNIQLASISPAYGKGWDDGYTHCLEEKKQKQMTKMLHLLKDQ